MKTTKKDFELYKKECKKWIKFFGLTEYRIEFFLEELNDARGQTRDYSDMMAIDISFPTELENINTIKKTAFHEVCEILLMRVRILALETYTADIVNKEIHSIIRRLENSIYEK